MPATNRLMICLIGSLYLFHCACMCPLMGTSVVLKVQFYHQVCTATLNVNPKPYHEMSWFIYILADTHWGHWDFDSGSQYWFAVHPIRKQCSCISCNSGYPCSHQACSGTWHHRRWQSFEGEMIFLKRNESFFYLINTYEIWSGH